MITTYPHGFTPDMKARSARSPLFLKYLERVQRQFTVKAVHIKHVTFFGLRAGLMMLELDAFDSQGEPVLPNTVFLRGNSVAILVVLRTENDDYAVLVEQPRLAAGRVTLEVPAGMLDNGEPSGKAIDEIHEETGIKISADQLDVLAQGRLFDVSPGGSDERMAFFALTEEVTQYFVDDLQGRTTGVAAEGEKITVRVLPLSVVAEQTTDLKTIMAIAFYNN